jgi:hypothetical protein
MTEAEWLASTDVREMYVFLRDRAVPGGAAAHRLSVNRKLRLFGVACCRRIMHLIPVAASRELVEVTERFADGLVTGQELGDAVAASMRACEEHSRRLAAVGGRPWRHEPHAINAVSRIHRTESAGRSIVIDAAASAWVWAAAVYQNLEGGDAGRELLAAEYARQADLLRDIAGNPFRPAAVEPAWLAWNDRCVERMAQGIYEERAFDRLPILHDALLDAGCDDGDILAHCRTSEGHVRGCWAIDLLLGKV